MVWRPVVGGLLAFPAALLFAVLTGSPLLLLGAGLPSGVVAGYWSTTVHVGAVYGLAVGCAIGLVAAVGGTAVMAQNPSPSHLPGLGLAMLYLWAVALTVECTVAGGFVAALPAQGE